MAVWLQKHQRSLLFLLSLLALAGVFAAFKLPISLFPDIQFPRIVVSVDSGDMPATQMVAEVTQPLEQVLQSVPEMQSIRSNTGQGAADLTVNFAWGSDMVTALLQVESAVNQALPNLPQNTNFTVTRMDPSSRQMMGFSLTSTNPDLVRLRNFAYTELRPLFATVPGVAKVEILGGQVAEYQVLINPLVLNHYQLSLNQVASILAANNVLTSVGRMQDQYQLFLVLSDNQLHTVLDLANIPIKLGAHSLVRLGDIASIKLGTAPNWTEVTANGHNAVLINLMQQENANTLAIVNTVNQQLAVFKSKLPKDISLKNYYDESELILASALSVRDALIIGAVLAGIILFLFLRNVRMMLIVALVLPVVLLITTLLLYVAHMSFNIMTLGGMAAAVGLIIDDGVVMLEHITRRLSESRAASQYSITHAAIEMFRPLLGSSCATIVIFIPLAFLDGVTGGFFKALAFTMAGALIASFFVAMLAVPLLGELLLKRKDAIAMEHVGPILGKMHRAYQTLLARLFAQQKYLLIALLGFIFIGYLCYRNVGSGFIPSVDEGGFVLDYLSPPGTSLTETNRLLLQVEAIIQQIPEVDSYSRRTGLQMGGGLTEPNTGDFFIHLKKPPRRNIDAIMLDVRNAVNAKVPGLNIDTAQLMEDTIGDLTAVPQPIEIKVFGTDQQQIENLANTIAAKLNTIPAVVEIDPGIVLSGSSINIHVNPARAALLGLNPALISEQLNTLLNGQLASSINANYYALGVRVGAPDALKIRIDQLELLPINLPNGKMIPLGSVAKISISKGQAEINREDLQQMDAVTARIEGRDMGSTMKDVIASINKIPLPFGVHIAYGGLYQEQQKSFHDLMLVFISALLLIALLLLFIYESFAIVLSILMTTLLTVPGIFIGLWLTQTELDIASMMGITMILGIVTEIAIFYFAELSGCKVLNQELLTHAGVMRMRPILMTSLIAILALLPLAFSASMQTPLAIAIIFGLIFAVPLVLLVLPVLYAGIRNINFEVWK